MISNILCPSSGLIQNKLLHFGIFIHSFQYMATWRVTLQIYRNIQIRVIKIYKYIIDRRSKSHNIAPWLCDCLKHTFSLIQNLEGGSAFGIPIISFWSAAEQAVGSDSGGPAVITSSLNTSCHPSILSIQRPEIRPPTDTLVDREQRGQNHILSPLMSLVSHNLQQRS